MQDSPGGRTSYTANALAPVGAFAILLTQVGTVTPATGGGTLQLRAHTIANLALADGTVIMPLGEFLSVGFQDDECS